MDGNHVTRQFTIPLAAGADLDYSKSDGSSGTRHLAAMTQLDIAPLHDDFGARVTGTTLSGDLADADLARIRRLVRHDRRLYRAVRNHIPVMQ